MQEFAAPLGPLGAELPVDTQYDIETRFYRPVNDLGSLVDAASEVCRRGGRIYGALLAISEPLDVLAGRLRHGAAVDRGFDIGAGRPYLVRFPSRPRRPQSAAPVVPRAFLWEEPPRSIVGVLSCQVRDAFEFAVSALHWYLLPDVSRVYLRTSEIQRTLNHLARDSEGLAIRVRECVSRSLIDDPRSFKKVSTNREWTDEDYSTVFQKLSEGRRWLSSLRLELRSSRSATGRIWRDASFSCDSGFVFFFRTVVEGLEQAVTQSRQFFEKRDRLSSPRGMSHPLRIVYPEPMFKDKAQNLRLLDTLERLPNSALSVFHPNPYLHASLVDYADGSSYEVWVTSPDSILIVPKRKATNESIQRLCNHICDKFEEGDVREFVAL